MLGLFLAVALLLGAQSPPALPADDLGAGKALYAAGTYEEALARLDKARAPAVIDEADQYRALCLLALGRLPESQKVLDELVARSPLYRMPESEVPPRLLSLFHDTRKKRLPAAVRTTYAQAKASYDAKDYQKSVGQLIDLIAMLKDDDLVDTTGSFGDMKMLADGLLELAGAKAEAAKAEATRLAAEAAQKASQPASAPPPVTAPNPAPTPPPAPVAKVYTSEDKDVTAPVALAHVMPEWHPPTARARQEEYRGAVRVTINEQGKVENVSLVQSVTAIYDAQLLAAARQWTYKPASRNGTPVKYSKMELVTLSPK